MLSPSSRLSSRSCLLLAALVALALAGCTRRSVSHAQQPAASVAGVVRANGSPVGAASGGGQQAPAGSRISWQGDNRFLLGANVPWFNWACDFGCGASGGVSDPNVQAKLDPVFRQARAAGLSTLRWWIFEGDTKQQIDRDASGAPAAIKPAVYADIDAALALAEKYGLSYDLVLFSSPGALPPGWLTDPAQRAALVSTLSPLFARYAGNPHLLSWEVFNEPEQDIWNKKIDQQPVQDSVKAIATAVHANSHTYVTVGSLMLDGLPMWVGLGLDYYQAHWYDYMNTGNYDALLWTYADVQARYKLDAPLVIGEYYDGADSTPLDRLGHFYDGGYAGAWAWSLFPDHTNDKMAIDLPANNLFNSQHTDISAAVDLGVTIPTYAPYVEPSFTVVAASPAITAAAGSTVSIPITVTSATATTSLVDIEVYDSTNKKVGQQFFDNETFTAGQSKDYTMTWKEDSPSGTYTVMAGVFSPGWGKVYQWNASVNTATLAPHS